MLIRWRTQNEEGNTTRPVSNLKKEKKKKYCVWDPAHSLLWPRGCQSVLEAKIEIPDTPLVNFAHASPALEQNLL